MVGAGPRLQLRPHDEGTQESITGKAAEFHLGLQMGQFLFVQMERNEASQAITAKLMALSVIHEGIEEAEHLRWDGFLRLPYWLGRDSLKFFPQDAA